MATVDTSMDGERLRKMEEMECGHYVGHGYVSNWGMQFNSMRRRHRRGEAPPSTSVPGYRKYLRGTESEMKRTRRVGKDKSNETEKKGSMRRIHWLMKNKYGKRPTIANSIRKQDN